MSDLLRYDNTCGLLRADMSDMSYYVSPVTPGHQADRLGSSVICLTLPAWCLAFSQSRLHIYLTTYIFTLFLTILCGNLKFLKHTRRKATYRAFFLLLQRAWHKCFKAFSWDKWALGALPEKVLRKLDGRVANEDYG